MWGRGMLRKKSGASWAAVLRWGASSAGGSGGGDWLVKSQRWAVKAVARERNGCLIPRYTGEGAVALHALARFHWQTAAEAVSQTVPSLPRSHGWLFVCKKLLDKSGEDRYTRHVVSNN